MTQIMGIVGQPGAGKSTLAAYLAYREKVRGRKVTSNMELAFEHDPLPKLPTPRRATKGVLAETDEEYVARVQAVFGTMEDSLVLIDEAHIYVDSRVPSARKNLVWSYFFTQTRKRSVDLIFTTQFFHQIDLRLRSLCSAVLECQAMRDYTVIHVWQPTGTEWERGKKLLLYRPPVYSLFDTRQVITGTSARPPAGSGPAEAGPAAGAV